MSGTAQFLSQAEEFRRVLEPAGWLGLDRVSPHARALTFLLPALGWRGQAKQICEALPHMPGELDKIDLLNSMINLGFYARSTTLHLHNTDSRLTPCLFVCKDDVPYILLPDAEKTGCEVYNPADDSIRPLAEVSDCYGTLYRFTMQTPDTITGDKVRSNVSEKPFRWFRQLIRRFDTIFLQAFMVSFLINVLALASSLFVMVVYDKVIGSRSVETLQYLVFGAVLAMIMEAILRYLRARSLAFFGVRIDAITSQLIFERLLFLPPRLIESSSIPSQVARIKDFDSIRDFFAGPTGIAVMELPFTIIFFITIAVIGGPLAVVPVILGFCYLLLALIMLPRIQARTEEGAVAGVKRQALLVETMQKIRALKAHGLADTWWQRFHELSGQSAMTGFSSAFLSSLIEAFAYGLSVIAGIGTLTFGIWLVWQGRITTGALIASMMLVWRVLTPMQAIVNSLIRIRFIFRSIAQVHKLVRTPPEGKLTAVDPELFRLRGDITFNGVGLRYTGEQGPIISGMNLQIKAGEIIAVAGGSGSGKTSILKLANGLYTPQMGSILIDGLDIRQRDPVELRKNISYVPQLIELFHGTIEKNLRMVKPDATDDELMEAITWAGAMEEIRALPRGLNTFIGDYRSEQLSSVFAFQLNLARGYLRDAPIMLFDEFPSAIINDTAGELFREYLQKMRGKRTILFVTDRKADVLLADRLIYLTGTGQVLAGQPDELLNALQG
ncbi:MAG TPA: ATP-binding cassette domain-containing protein [Desulfobulbaceae bacterium]|nr:ATP-binding cassette domain-containing protein [Desulfobulbaceae bacterium]